MSTGNPDPAPKRSPEPLKEIPLSWFVGIGKKEQGIITVSFSKEFQNLGASDSLEFKHHFNEYTHYMGNRFIGDRLVKSSDEIKDIQARDIVKLAEIYIKKVTGFSPGELSQKRTELAKLYEGKQEAPFAIEFY